VLDKPVPSSVMPGRSVFVGRWGFLAAVDVAGMIFLFLLESLILAQDERWRRA
jgi:hypothetical protein